MMEAPEERWGTKVEGDSYLFETTWWDFHQDSPEQGQPSPGTAVTQH